MKRAMDIKRVIGSCLPLFILAVTFDIMGIVLLFLGIFANLRIEDRFYGDFLIYTGSIIMFFSLGLWLMWYAGNVQVKDDSLMELKHTNSIVELARRISQRLSEKLKTEVMGKCVAEDEASQMGTPQLKPGRVTWGKSTVYVNQGYEHHEQDADGPVDGEVDKKDVLDLDMGTEETEETDEKSSVF